MCSITVPSTLIRSIFWISISLVIAYVFILFVITLIQGIINSTKSKEWNWVLCFIVFLMITCGIIICLLAKIATELGWLKIVYI